MAPCEAALVGRRDELNALESMLSSLEDGHSMVGVEVLGEPGIGKSRLVAEARVRADRLGHLVLDGRASEFEQEQPFGVFIDALDDYLASLENPCLARLNFDDVPELATVFPSWGSQASAERSALQAERYRTYRAVRSLLEELSRARRVVITLDDIQWADPASQELIAYLLAHPPRCAMLAVVADRPAQTPERLSRALAAAAREGTLRRLPLEALTAVESEQLIGPGFSREAMSALCRESGSNPFYLQQLVRAGVASGPARPSGIPGDVPPLVQTSLAAEISALPEPVRKLLQGGAVAGDPFEIDLAAAAAGICDVEALEMLDSLLALDLVRTTSVPQRFAFRHPIVRRSVYKSAGAGWRSGAHARAAAALSAAGAPASARAHHVECSAKRGDDEAVAVLIEAGDAAASRAPAAASQWYAGALRLLPDDERHDARRLELLMASATTLGAAGQLAESRAALLDALDRLPPGAPARAGLVGFCAGIDCLLGRANEARERLTRFFADLGDEDSVDSVAIKIELSVAALWLSDFESMQSWARQAVEESTRLGLQPLEVVARALVAYATFSLGGTDEALTEVAGAVGLFEALDADGVASRLDTAFYLGWAENLLERFDDAIRHFDRGISICRAIGQGQWLVPLMHGKVWPLTWSGRLEAARPLADETVEAARVTSHVMFLPLALYARSFVATEMGELDLAIRTAEEAVELVRPLEANALTAMPALALASALVEAGEVQRARDVVLADPSHRLVGRGATWILFETMTKAGLGTARLTEASDWARWAEEISGREDLVLETAAVRRTRAHVLLAAGKAREAADHLLPIVDAATLASPLFGARTRLLAATALARAGDRDRAITELRRTRAGFEGCAARRQVEVVDAELRRLGRPAPACRQPGPRYGLESLSERQREIADLVRAGCTNREIATRCYISEKTVERHLSQIFTKLGVASRAAVAGIAARANAPETT